MADVGEKAAKQLTEITECSICMSDFTDPRMLPCIHTFCLECLKRTGEKMQVKPGDKMPCPLCRKEFIVPVEGINGVQKNFFMENLLEFKSTLQIGSSTIIFCDTCQFRNEGKASELQKASMICLECQENYCDSCVKVHQLQKVSRSHHTVKIGSDDKSEMKPAFYMKCCTKHTNKPLDYYCSDCKKIVCVSCFVESHKSHDCKDVNTVDEEFRKTIERKAKVISNYIYGDGLTSLIDNTANKKVNILRHVAESENSIHQRTQQLKDFIDLETKSLLDELSVIKSNHLKQIEIEMEEIDRSCAMLKSFEAYCTELRLKGSASDICSSVDQLLARADDLERDHEAIIGRSHQSVEVSFQTADMLEVAQKSKIKFVGKIYVKDCVTEDPLTKTVDNSTTVIQIMKRDMSAKTTYQKSAKGPIAIYECSQDGKYVALENTGRKDELLGNWRLLRNIDGKDSATYTFSDSFVLRPGQKIKVWAKGTRPFTGASGDIESDQNWGVGAHIITKLFNPLGEDRATHIQQTKYA